MSVSPTPRYRLDPTDRIVMRGGRILTCKGQTPTGYLMQPFGSEITDHVTFVEFEEERQHPDFRQDTLFYTESRARARARTLIESNADIPSDELADVRWKEAWVLSFFNLWNKHRAEPPRSPEERVKRTGPGFKAAIRLAAPALMQLAIARKESSAKHGRGSRETATASQPRLTKSGKARKAYAGTTFHLRSPPCARTLQNWVLAYEEAGCQMWGLRQCHCRRGNREPRYDGDAIALMMEAVYAYLTPKGDSYEQCYKAYTDRLDQVNADRAQADQPPIARIGFTTYRARVNQVSRFNRDAARRSLEFAIRKYSGVKKKFDVTRLGELVQIDGWKVSLVNLSAESGIWATLTPEQKAIVPRERWTLLRAIDVASRAVLGEILTRSETTEAAIMLVRMMLGDKTGIAAAMGATTPWDYFGVPEAIVTDAGSAFRSDRFRQVLADLSIRFDAPEVGRPNKRAHVERSFGTTRTQLLPNFTGQTFANIQDKGDYDPEADASLFVDELARALVLYDVDVYQNTPHEGLLGETPRAAWQRLMLQGAGFSRVTPGAHQQRAIFGIALTRTLSKRGIRVLGLHYQSQALAALFARDGNVSVAVRIDPEDLGWISVEIDRVWKATPCATAGFQGVPIAAWLDVVTDQRRRHAITAAASRPIVAEALRKIRSIAETAEQRLGIVPHTYNPEAIGRAEDKILRGFDIPEDLARPDGPSGTDPLAHGIPVTGPVTVEARTTPQRQRPDDLIPPPTPSPPASTDDGEDDAWTMETPDA